MPGLSLAQIRTQVQDAHSELRQTERALEEARAAASRQYKGNLSVLADEVDAIIERVRATVKPEERHTPIQTWLDMTLRKLGNQLKRQSNKLRDGVIIVSEEIAFCYSLKGDELRKIRQEEQVASWLEEHPDESIQGYLAKIIQEKLEEEQVAATCHIYLTASGRSWSYHETRIEEVVYVSVSVVLT